VGRYTPKLDVRELLAERNLTVVALEEAAGLSRGSVTRILTGRRGSHLPLETAARLAYSMRLPLGRMAEALKLSIDRAKERRLQKLRVELVRRQAQLR
jgi:transcriptional regulator with XRE-family HTH domain